MRIHDDYSLLDNNTFGVDVKADYFMEYDNVEELKQLLDTDLLRERRFLNIGGGSNILFVNDFHGVALHSCIKGIEKLEEDEDKVTLRVGAGEVWDEFVQYCCDNSYGGAENLSGIPGSVGAVPIQNIGAYGAEVKSIIKQVECISASSGRAKTFSAEDCHFAYRDSVFKHRLKGKYIVTYVVFELNKSSWQPCTEYGSLATEIKKYDKPTMQNIRLAVLDIRKRKLPEPKVLGNAGSFYTNPVIERTKYERLKDQHPDMPCYEVSRNMVKVPAGWLIEQCGWKGRSVGKVAVHGSQALVLINKGGANGLDIINLSDQIRQSVRDKFGIDLKLEVNIVFG